MPTLDGIAGGVDRGSMKVERKDRTRALSSAFTCSGVERPNPYLRQPPR
jgi:hypothetical protein